MWGKLCLYKKINSKFLKKKNGHNHDESYTILGDRTS